MFTVLRLAFDARRPAALRETPEAVGVFANPPSSAEALAAALSTGSAARFNKSERLTAVSVGPVLDSPDKVQLEELAHEGGKLSLRIDYARIRMTGLTMPSSLPWRPILIAPVPSALSPGLYEVEALWRAVSAIPDGRPLPVADLRQASRFEIVGADARAIGQAPALICFRSSLG